jgi:hypothetical protein
MLAEHATIKHMLIAYGFIWALKNRKIQNFGEPLNIRNSEL